jgi:hypothetical protein
VLSDSTRATLQGVLGSASQNLKRFLCDDTIKFLEKMVDSSDINDLRELLSQVRGHIDCDVDENPTIGEHPITFVLRLIVARLSVLLFEQDPDRMSEVLMRNE